MDFLNFPKSYSPEQMLDCLLTVVGFCDANRGSEVCEKLLAAVDPLYIALDEVLEGMPRARD